VESTRSARPGAIDPALTGRGRGKQSCGRTAAGFPFHCGRAIFFQLFDQPAQSGTLDQNAEQDGGECRGKDEVAGFPGREGKRERDRNAAA